MSRSSPSSALVGLLLLTSAACSRGRALEFPTASKLPDEERKPDGIAVDLSSEPPPYAAAADTDAGVVTLRTPLGSAAAFTTLRTFFEGVTQEDIASMSTVADGSATVSDTRSSAISRVHNLSYLWRQRFSKYDYTALAGRLVYREADVRTYRSADAAALPYELKAAMLQDDLLPGDLVLRVPIISHTLKSERMFGNEMTFWLRRDGDRYLIYRVAEEVPL